MGTTRRVLVAVLAVVAGATTAAAAPPPGWEAWRYLLGEWSAVGSGRPGEASGGFGFATDLEGGALVRRSHADYPAAPGRPAAHHEDLMVLYREGSGSAARALYLDNEGHVIHYAAEASAGGTRWTFTSAAAPAAPRYRFTYMKLTRDSLAMRFEIAPPGKPDSLATYLQGTARRRR
ncbi:MAG: hypothetical protein HZC42_05395 [Candidatus Eisenbacteria bacterium]|nr:hypothetical protein [Candidatus Eisenbacteria bacterium]